MPRERPKKGQKDKKKKKKNGGKESLGKATAEVESLDLEIYSVLRPSFPVTYGHMSNMGALSVK